MRSMKALMNASTLLRRVLLAAVAALLGLSIVAVCFAGYLTPAALFFLLSGSVLCE